MTEIRREAERMDSTA